MSHVECPDTNLEDLVGVACPQCGQVFPEEHSQGCSILWPMAGIRMTTPQAPAPNGDRKAVRDPLTNFGPCGVCKNDVVTANPWFIADPTKPSNKGAPLHDECKDKWDHMSIRVTPHPKVEGQPAPQVTKAFEEQTDPSSAYGEPSLPKEKVAELQEGDEGIKVLQAKAKIARALGEAAVEFGHVAPDQETYDQYTKALGVLQTIALEGKNPARDAPLFAETRQVNVPLKIVGPKVFLGKPYCGEVDDGAALMSYGYPYLFPDSPVTVTAERESSSALCYCFNRCWTAMLGHKGFPFDWFVLQHQDIEPEGPWIDVLIEEAEKGKYDVMTAISPLKDDRGLSSTAYGSMEHDWDRMRRITLIEKDTMLPETFGIEEVVKTLGVEGIRGTPILLNNTGIMAIRVKEKRLQFDPRAAARIGPFAVGLPDEKRGMWPWCFPGFRMHDRIDFAKGFASAEFISEDWDSGRWFARHGLRVGATRRIDLGHYGRSSYRNRWDKGQTHDEAFIHHVRMLAGKKSQA